MRGSGVRSGMLFSYVDLEARVRRDRDHPLRVIREIANAALALLNKRIEEVFGWIKGSAGLARMKLRGRAGVDGAFTLALAAYNLIRLPKLLAPA